MSYRPVLEEVIGHLGKNPYIVLECALLLPGWSNASLVKFEKQKGVWLPRPLTQFYTEIGGAHISWRLTPLGYEKLYPNVANNKYRYDIAGNLDLLSPEELIDGFTSDGWKDVYLDHLRDYQPIDFSSYFLNLGCAKPLRQEDDRFLLNVLDENQLQQLDITLAEYLQRGANILFLVDWQLTLLDDEKYALEGMEMRALIKAVGQLLADESN